jgi:hypothetical protein
MSQLRPAGRLPEINCRTSAANCSGAGAEAPRGLRLVVEAIQRRREAMPLQPQSEFVLWIVQGADTVPTPAPEETVTPFMNQMDVSPLVSCHKRSLFPSPL